MYAGQPDDIATQIPRMSSLYPVKILLSFIYNIRLFANRD